MPSRTLGLCSGAVGERAPTRGAPTLDSDSARRVSDLPLRLWLEAEGGGEFAAVLFWVAEEVVEGAGGGGVQG